MPINASTTVRPSPELYQNTPAGIFAPHNSPRPPPPVTFQSLIAPSLKQSIRELAQKLEDVPDELKDWHPGSNGQVLDLVHPSLYCLHIGKSLTYDLQPGHTDALARLGAKGYFEARP